METNGLTETSNKAQVILAHDAKDYCHNAIATMREEFPDMSEQHIFYVVWNSLNNALTNFVARTEGLTDERRTILHKQIKTLVCREIDRKQNAFADGN